MREINIADPAGFHKTIVAWQKEEGRHHLPWMVPDAYLRWLSEIMLQQTQVSVVVDYFGRFTKTFPTVKDLAEAPETEVMRLWAGLGYYSRARNLHRAAQMVMTDFGGAFPQTLEDLMKLPGVGRSTASAIGSFCFDLQEPVLDGNVKRVLSRVTAFETAVDSTEGDKALLGLAQSLVRGAEPGVFNQGMMDIGALVCARTRPKCDACPVSDLCRSFLAGNPENYPKKKPKIVRTERTLKLALVEKEGRCLLVQRTAGDIWPGLWCLPEVVNVPDSVPVLRIKRVLTHLNLTIEVYRTDVLETLDLDGREVFWVQKIQTSAANDLPLPTPIRLIFEKLAESSLLQ